MDLGEGVGTVNGTTAIVTKRRSVLLSAVVATTMVGSVVLWTLLGQLELRRACTFSVTSLTAFALGVFVGFLLSTYDDEADSVGQIRTWLLGGLASVSVVELSTGGEHVESFVARFVPVDHADDAGLYLGVFIIYSIAGLLAMYFGRELGLNVPLARERKRRRALEQLKRSATEEIEREAPAIARSDPRGEAPIIKEDRAGNVRAFASMAETLVREGKELDAETSFEAGRALYHTGKYDRALPYLARAAQKKSFESEAMFMLGSAYGELGRPEQAAAALEKIEKAPDVDAVVLKHLGYYLLWNDDRTEDALKYSEEYLSRRPGDAGAIFNKACAHAQLHDQAMRGGDDAAQQRHRKEALANLRRAIDLNPDIWRTRARELADEDFEGLQGDDEFRALAGLPT